MICSRAFLTNFEVFHLVMKHNVICLMLLKQNNFKRRELVKDEKMSSFLSGLHTLIKH